MKEARNIILMLGAMIIVLLVLGLVKKNSNGQSTILSQYIHLNNVSPSPTSLSNLKPIGIGATTIMISVADNDATRAKGLGGITSLPADQGMLFTFSSRQIRPSFWMKDMQIPLDFIWISNNKVAEITPNVPAPAPNTPDNQLSIYTPDENIDFVLEVNANFATKNSIKVGDSVTGL